MNTPRLSLPCVALLLAACASPLLADDRPKPAEANPAEAAKNAPAKSNPVKPPTESELRATITKGLGFLAKDGEAWMEAKDCNGCHHLPQMLWSFREAKLRGFEIDQKKFDEWLKWADERSTNKNPGLEMLALMKLAMPDRPWPELTKLIVAGQQADGSWKPAGQFATLQRRGEPDARASAVRLFLTALATHGPSPEADAARAKAAAVLGKKDVPTSMESLVFRILYARSIGNGADVDALRADILRRQRGDGGWASYLGANLSDPLATGQVLYALQASAADPKAADAIARAQQWLVRTQRDDGGWQIDITHISGKDRSAPDKAKSFKEATAIYTCFGSGWAMIGLLQAVPVKGGNAVP